MTVVTMVKAMISSLTGVIVTLEINQRSLRGQIGNAFGEHGVAHDVEDPSNISVEEREREKWMSKTVKRT